MVYNAGFYWVGVTSMQNHWNGLVVTKNVCLEKQIASEQANNVCATEMEVR